MPCADWLASPRQQQCAPSYTVSPSPCVPAVAAVAAPTAALSSKLLPSPGALVLATRDRGDVRELCGDLEGDLHLELDADELEAAERWLLPYHEADDDDDDLIDEYVEWAANRWTRGWGLGAPGSLESCGNLTNGGCAHDNTAVDVTPPRPAPSPLIIACCVCGR